MQKLLLLACLTLAVTSEPVSLPRKRQRAEVIDGRVEIEYQARITAVKKVIKETEFVTATQTIIDSPYCVSYSKELPPCTSSDPEPEIKPARTVRRMAKSLTPEDSYPAAPPVLHPSVIAAAEASGQELQVIELEGINQECLNQDEGVTFMTTELETHTMTVTRTRPGAQTVTISIAGCLPSPMPFNAPTC